ncbi:hypothetical protein Tco_0098640 [Tanacetum coccineum]
MHDSSQRPPIVCVKCGNPVEGPSCQGCALWRKKLKEVWFTTCHENGNYQDLLNTSESSDDNTNVVNAPREPFVMESFVNNALPSQFLENELPSNSKISLNEAMTSICDMVGQFIQKKEEEKRIEEEQAAKDRYWKIPVCYDDDDDEESYIPLKDIIIAGLPPCVAITPVLLTKEPVDSSIMEIESILTLFENGINLCFTRYFDLMFSKDFDSLLDEFTGELTLPHSIPPGIDDVNLDPKGDIDKFHHGVLASKEKSPSSPSHRGLKAFQLSPESPMLIHGDNTPNLGVRHTLSIPLTSKVSGIGQAKDYPDSEASRAHRFCPSITRASNPQLQFGNPIS